MTSKVLPNEVLTEIFQLVSRKDIFACQFVCQSWHILAKHFYYNDVEFNSSLAIIFFISSVRSNHAQFTNIPPPGIFVKKFFFCNSNDRSLIEFKITLKHVEALAELCPKVVSIDCEERLNDSLAIALLSLPEELVWKDLAYLPPHIASYYQPCAYKFRRSLKAYRWDFKRGLNLNYLKEFQSLTELDMQSTGINSIQVIEQVLDSAPLLVKLALAISDFEDKSSTLAVACGNHKEKNSSLKTLKLHIFDMNECLIDYFTKRLLRLKCVEIYTLDIIDISKLDKSRHTFEKMMNWLYSVPVDFNLRIQSREYNMIPVIARHYLANIFNSVYFDSTNCNTSLFVFNINSNVNQQPPTQSSLAISSTKEEGGRLFRSISIQLPEFETSNKKIQEEYISLFSRHVEQLTISYEGTPLYNQGCIYFLELVLEQCIKVNKVKLLYSELDDLYLNGKTCINESITRFEMSNCQIGPKFFEQLSYCCPNLQYMTLNRNFYTRDERHAIIVNMPHTTFVELQVFSEIHSPWMFLEPVDRKRNKDWTIKIQTALHERYFNIVSTSSFTVKEISITKGRLKASDNPETFIEVYCMNIRQFCIMLGDNKRTIWITNG